MIFPRFRPKRVVFDAELARFRLHLWSPDKEMDSTINREIKYFERGDGDNDIPYETGVSRLQREVERVVKIYLPRKVEVREFNVEYSQTVTVTFSLVWAGAISLYILISRYDNFRRSLDRIKDELARLLGRVARRSHAHGPLMGDMEWEPSHILVELEEIRSKQDKASASLNLNILFVWYLIVSNIILAMVVALLVLHALRKVYF